MLSVEHKSRYNRKFLSFIIFLISGLFLIPITKTHAANMCIEGLKELQGSQGVIQDKGGIWGYIEKSSNLKDHSILGLQIDGKLQRLIVSFENLCEEGKTPTPKLHGLILGLLGDARMTFNSDADRQPKEKILEKLNALNKGIDELLAQLPK
jgi:hypothetical protein